GAGRDHGLRRHGRGPPGASERPLRRGRPAGLMPVPGALRSAADWVAAHPVASFLVVFAVFPFLVPYQALATQVLIWGLFALGFNLLHGYTRLLCVGRAAYSGVVAYGAGSLLAKLHFASVWGALGAGLLMAGAGGAIIGFFFLRRHGILFPMLTLALAP